MGNWVLSVNNAEFVSVDLIGEKNQVILESSIIASIYEAVKHFGKGYSPRPIISCPIPYHDSTCPNKANLVQDHGYFFTVKFLLRSSQFFT